MRVFKKSWQIFRTHGLRGLVRRAYRRVRLQMAAQAEAAAQRKAWNKLIARVGQNRPVFFPRHENPLVSIIIPVCNHVRFTAACLNSILREFSSIPCEVIVVDDGSTDGTGKYLASCSGIRVVTHTENQGFVISVNDGAAGARGRFLHFLNNDTLVTPGWVSALLRAFDSRDNVGAVGSQLRAPDGTVSEAGALVWRDGNAANFARGRSAVDSSVCFPREVDYCSGASLMVRADLFTELGGFSREFAPGYYEDVDLCFRLRAAGYRVMYTPESVVVHFEGGTSGQDTSSGMKRYQLVNRAKFADKWEHQLVKHFPPDVELIERAARRLAGIGTILVVDSFIPFDDRSAGGRRLLAVMRLMRELGWHVIFVSDEGVAHEPYASRARKAGIEVLPHRGDALSTISSLPVPIDVAWISRPDLLAKFAPLLHRRTTAKLIYDTVDLHFLRLQREAALTGRDNGWESMRRLEIDLIRKADCTVVTSEAERDMLAALSLKAHVVPIVEQPTRAHTGYSARHDILFLGNYTHTPNADAAVWMVHEVMPLIWEHLPDLRLVLAGADPTPPVERLAEERVIVTGYVPDARPLFESARAFVAPLRFGAGMKGKVVQAISYGLPTVTTPVGAEGIGLKDGSSALIRETAADFAEGVLRVYSDEALWTEMSNECRRVAQLFSPEAVRASVAEALQAALEQDREVGLDLSLASHPA
jgi:GT2 family glycosyltransferase